MTENIKTATDENADDQACEFHKKAKQCNLKTV